MTQASLIGIKNIILDLGGVIIDVDYSLTVDAFHEVGMTNFESVFSQAKQLGFVDEFEKGNISSDEFRNNLRKLSGKNFSDAEIDTCWNALILDLNPNNLSALQYLTKKYRLFLLSNNNAIHYQNVISKVEQLIPFTEFTSLFEQNYYSQKIRLRKPDKEIFEFVLHQNNLQAQECLFLDDSIQHLHSAEKLGIKTLLVNSINQLQGLTLH